MPDDSRVNLLREPSNQYIRQPTLYIDKIIEPQFKGSIFYDPNFFKNFLPLAPSSDSVVGLCLRYDWHLRSRYEWKFPGVINGEQCLHQPILYLLNTIKSATDIVCSSLPGFHIYDVPNLTDIRSSYKDYHLPLELDIQGLALPSGDVEDFVDWSSRDLAHNLPRDLMLHLRPDVILFRGKSRHWSNIRFVVEIKEHAKYMAAGMKQLARYAHAVFAHQPSRRHFYSLLICGTGAIFVRFDHAGILYSNPLDVVRNPAFVAALASLLSLDEVDERLNPAFNFQADGSYIDLFECMLGKAGRVASEDKSGAHGTSVSNQMKTRRFRILSQHCCPTSRRVNGSGTFVFHISEHFPPESEGGERVINSKRGGETKLDTDDGVACPREKITLKLSWRLDNDKSKGQALEAVEGTFGVPQHVSHGDIMMP